MIETTQYLYRIQPTRSEMLTHGPTEKEAEVTSQHYQYLKGLLEKGELILAGRTLNTDGSTFGIVILNAETEEAAREIVANDPVVRESVMRAELFPYRVALISEKNV
jgi:uncharacterized protein YciI